MNYLNLLDNKPVALPKKTVNVKLPPQNIASKLALDPNPDAEKALTVKIVDERAEKQDTVDRDQLQTLFLRNNISKVLPIDLSKPPSPAEPPPVVVKPPKAVKLPNKLSVIPEDKEETDFTAAAADPSVAPFKEPGAAAANADELVPSKKRALKQNLAIQERSDFEVDLSMKLGNATLRKRLNPTTMPDKFKVSNYYMNNREVFVSFINKLFNEHKVALLDDTSKITCENIGKTTGEFDLLTHQKLVRDYLNLYTPYRGLLLFHGLGSGKTCTSIAIAEGMKTMRDVVVMTPASLRTNYMEELKKCGDYLYRRQQFWEWISTAGQPDVEHALHKVLNLPLENIRTNGGAWLVNVKKPSNFNTLSNNQQKSLNSQINLMISQKYQFINYNGLNRRIVEVLTKNHTHNMFDNKVVIIDEAHNFISRIVTKLNMMYANKENAQGVNISEPVPEHFLFHRPSKSAVEGSKKRNESEPKPRYKYTSISLYDYLLNAKNAKIVLLTGTPIINYPNEIAILYNILRGYIKTFSLPIRVETDRPINQDTLQDIFRDEQILDTIDYTTRKGTKEKQLVITRNPFGFSNTISETGDYGGVNNAPIGLREGMVVPGQVSDTQFIEDIKRTLHKHNVEFNLHDVKVSYHKALPDKTYEFAETFMDANFDIDVHKMDKFSRRIIGLTSYFRSAQEELMPRYNDKFEPVYIEMSDYQFDIYENVREKEREKEEKSVKALAKKKNADDTIIQSNTFKIFSRMTCNFVMPVPPGRPYPGIIRSAMATSGIFDKREPPAKNFDEKDKADDDATIVAKALSKEEKAQAKAIEKEAKVAALAQAKQEKADAKALEKEEKDQAKAAAKALAKAQVAPRKTKKKSPTPPLLKEGMVQKPKSKTKKLRIIGNVQDEEKALEKDVERIGEQVGGAKDGPSASEAAGASGENAYAVFFEKIAQQQFNNEDDMENDDDEDNDANMMLLEKSVRREYEESVERALNTLRERKNDYLSLDGLQMYSPKFLRMIETINDPDKIGLHLVYSQFRTLEGIGIFAIALEANGFARFKIKRQSLTWEIDMTEDDWSKHHYALYTGTEDTEEKEIIRNVYNGDWEKVPDTIASVLRQKNRNNNLGEIIKVFMITASGSEGINLRNTRHVHIMEPYWNPVRAEQVIGRARRICSHQGLPLELQTVEVFLYLMKFSESQLTRASRSLKLNDVSKADARVVFTTEQSLYEISMHKKSISDLIVRSIKQSSIDCAIHVKGNTKENIQCINFGSPNDKEVAFYPNIEHDADIAHSEQTNVAAKQQLAQRQTLWESRTLAINGTQYVQKKGTDEIYDYGSYMSTRENQKKEDPSLGVSPILVGHLVKKNGKYVFIKIGEAV
jgi:hypothetical protein